MGVWCSTIMFSENSNRELVGEVLQEKINELHFYFMPLDLNVEFHKNKVTAIKKLKYILKHTNRHNLQEADFEDVILCSLALVHYFGMRLKMSTLTSKYWFWCSKRTFYKAETAFQTTMDYLFPERSEVSIKITLNFFTVVELWPYESFVCQILEVVLYFTRGTTKLFNMLLTDIHCILFTDVKTARHRMRVLYELLKSENWVINKAKLLPFITRLLDFFSCSISRDNSTSYRYLRKGFEVCLRRIFERVDNGDRLVIIATMLNWFSLVSMNDDDVLEFSSILDHAAELYTVESYGESFKEGLIEHVLRNLIGSPNAMHSLVGCRLLLRFLDRKCNAAYLSGPKLFYEFTQVQLKLGVCDNDDKIFIRQHREELHTFIFKAIKMHCHKIVNLKALFSVICCIVLEVPCGLTAAVVACLIMTVQDFAINGENLLSTSRYWLHAIVISIMSLVCWAHKAPVLYRYVCQVIARRAKEAPHLNPPLLDSYKIGYHHVTWNKPTLFFEDWELRYALWKHFQETKPSLQARERKHKIAKKVPAMDVRS